MAHLLEFGLESRGLSKGQVCVTRSNTADELLKKNHAAGLENASSTSQAMALRATVVARHSAVRREKDGGGVIDPFGLLMLDEKKRHLADLQAKNARWRKFGKLGKRGGKKKAASEEGSGSDDDEEQ